MSASSEGTASGDLRVLAGGERWAVSVFLACLTLIGSAWALELHFYLPFPIFREQFLGVFLGLGLAATFLSVPARKGKVRTSVPIYDWLLAACSLTIGGYIAIWYPEISLSLASLDPERYLLGALAIVVAAEATRRLLGWTLIVLAAVFCLYARYAGIFDGFLNGKSSSWERIAAYVFLDSNGILGITLAVSATVVTAFVFFGQVLTAIGGDAFFNDIALALLGRYRGGTAKVTILSSSLFGMVSGSAVSNVVISGSVTIPMMKRAGYSGETAAAIEAVSSTGGQITPPVMGVAAFIVAEYLGVPYLEVATAALIPAILYYVSMFIQVDLESARMGLIGLPADALPKLRSVFKRGWIYLVPIAALVHTLLILRWPAGKAGMIAVVSAFVVAFLYKETRLSLLAIARTVTETGRAMLPLVAISAIAGIVIGSLQLSGLTFKFALVMAAVGGDELLLMLGLTAIVCIILGMGMPTVVIYVMLAVLIAPALIELGVRPMAAHLFIFYFGMLSMITPPVCIATYTAASMAQCDFWRSGVIGMRLGIAAYIVPFFFVFHPGLLMEGSAISVGAAIVTTTIGVGFIAIGVTGYLFAKLALHERALFLLAGACMFFPVSSPALIGVNLAGAVLGAAMTVVNRRSALSRSEA